MAGHICRQIKLPPDCAGKRLDQALALLLPEHSRSRLQMWIRNGSVQVDNKHLKPGDRIRGGESVTIQAQDDTSQPALAEAISLDILYEDEALIIINKPAGLVVHPGAGNPKHTLMNALLHFDPSLANIPRAGIVHRLDKDTSGLIIIARTLQSHTQLVKQLQQRHIHRQYEAVVAGTMITGGSITKPLGRHPKQRTRMAVVRKGKMSTTQYRIIRKYFAHTYLKLILETGRTHQIRVHMSYLHHPLVGDRDYGGGALTKGISPRLAATLRTFPRQALHACKLAMEHPISKKNIYWKAPTPSDIRSLLEALEEDAEQQ